MAKKPETKFRENYVVPFLTTLPNTVFFPIQQLAIVGDPDIFACVAGLFVAIELKAEGGKLGALQEYKLAAVRRCHGMGLVICPANWGQMKELLLQLSKGLPQ